MKKQYFSSVMRFVSRSLYTLRTVLESHPGRAKRWEPPLHSGRSKTRDTATPAIPAHKEGSPNIKTQQYHHIFILKWDLTALSLVNLGPQGVAWTKMAIYTLLMLIIIGFKNWCQRNFINSIRLHIIPGLSP